MRMQLEQERGQLHDTELISLSFLSHRINGVLIFLSLQFCSHWVYYFYSYLVTNFWCISIVNSNLVTIWKNARPFLPSLSSVSFFSFFISFMHFIESGRLQCHNSNLGWREHAGVEKPGKPKDAKGDWLADRPSDWLASPATQSHLSDLVWPGQMYVCVCQLV